MLDLLNEANKEIPIDGELAKDAVTVCKQWFTDHHIPLQFVDGQYVLLTHAQTEEQQGEKRQERQA